MIITNSVKNFKLEKKLEGETIIKFNDIGKIFYILLQGKLSVYWPSEYIEVFKDPITGA